MVIALRVEGVSISSISRIKGIAWNTVARWLEKAAQVCRRFSTRYTERLAEAGIEPSVGSRGDSYDNALAESIIGLYKTEVIHRRGPWRGLKDVEFATLEWVHWYNTQRLLEPIGNVAPVEYEMNYYRSQEGSLEMARLN